MTGFLYSKKATNHRELKAWRHSMVLSIVFCDEHVIAVLSLCHCFHNIFADSRCNRGSIRNCLLQVLHQCLCWLCGYELRERLCSVHRDTDRGGAGSVPSYLQSTDSRRSQASLLQRSCQTCYQNLQAAGESMRSQRLLYWKCFVPCSENHNWNFAAGGSVSFHDLTVVMKLFVKEMSHILLMVFYFVVLVVILRSSWFIVGTSSQCREDNTHQTGITYQSL